MKTLRRHSALLALIACLALLQACGGESSPTAATPPATPTPTPPPLPVSRVIAEGSMSGLEPFFLAAIPFVTSVTGTLQASVDWTFPNNDIDIYLVQGSCTIEQFNNNTCPFAAFSVSATAKPERVELPNAQPANYTLYVGNLGSSTEAFSFQVVLTSTEFASARSATAEGDVSAKGAALRGIQDLQ